MKKAYVKLEVKIEITDDDKFPEPFISPLCNSYAFLAEAREKQPGDKTINSFSLLGDLVMLVDTIETEARVANGGEDLDAIIIDAPNGRGRFLTFRPK